MGPATHRSGGRHDAPEGWTHEAARRTPTRPQAGRQAGAPAVAACCCPAANLSLPAIALTLHAPRAALPRSNGRAGAALTSQRGTPPTALVRRQGCRRRLLDWHQFRRRPAASGPLLLLPFLLLLLTRLWWSALAGGAAAGPAHLHRPIPAAPAFRIHPTLRRCYHAFLRRMRRLPCCADSDSGPCRLPLLPLPSLPCV